MSWGEFYAVVSAEQLESARTVGAEAKGIGKYPDAIWVYHPDRLDEYDRLLRRSGMPLLIPPFSFQSARIEHRGGRYVAQVPGLREPLDIQRDRVFLAQDWADDIDGRVGRPPPIPLPASDKEAAQAVVQEQADWRVRRELVQWEAFCAVLDGNAAIPTGAGRRVENRLRERQRQEVRQVRAVPNLVAEVLKAVHHGKRPMAERKGAVRGSINVIENDNHVQLRATLTTASRNAMMGRHSKSPRWTGKVEATMPLPYEWNGEIVVGAGATAPDMAEQMLSLCAELDVDFHRTLTAITGEIVQNGFCVASALAVHRLRGGAQKMNAEERRRYDGHLNLLRTLYFRMELPGGQTIEMPAVARGARTADRKQEVFYAVPPQAVAGMPTSVVGLMLDQTYGHRAGFLLDKRLLNLGDSALSLGTYLARQWAARMTINEVEGQSAGRAHSLETVLDSTPMRGTWRSRTAKQGRRWLKERVDGWMAELNDTGLHGLGGTATVEWDEKDIGKSRLLIGEPPPHIREAHLDRSSKRIAAAKKKRERIDTRGDDRPARRRGKKATES